MPLLRFDPANEPGLRLPDSSSVRYEQYEAPVRYYAARWLGFEPGAVMVRRVVVLSLDGHPVLSSTSYLPVELFSGGDDWREVVAAGNNAWQKVGLGSLALAGYTVTSTEPWSSYCRLPTAMERSTLGIRTSAEIPVNLYVRPFHIHTRQPDPLRAGVIVRTRSDLVVCQVGPDHSGLLLEPELVSRGGS